VSEEDLKRWRGSSGLPLAAYAFISRGHYLSDAGHLRSFSLPTVNAFAINPRVRPWRRFRRDLNCPPILVVIAAVAK
jgi:hypothetical protein